MSVQCLTSDDFDLMLEKTFYGILYNTQTGSIKVHQIDDTNIPINLDDDRLLDDETYKYYMWSKKLLKFEFQQNGHLQMQIV